MKRDLPRMTADILPVPVGRTQMPEVHIENALQLFAKMYQGKLADRVVRIADTTEVTETAVSSVGFREDRGNWPKIFHRSAPTARSLVLVHGLTDSPFWVEGIARFLAARDQDLTVVLPLLPGHGRCAPIEKMEAVRLADWRSVVDNAVDVAAVLGNEVSVGGFSTGGALAVDKATRTPQMIDGRVLLFSAALDITTVEKIFLTCHVAALIADVKSGKTDNSGEGGDPCKYSRMFMCGAELLTKLISELRHATDAAHGFLRYPHRTRTFVAHSEADAVIDVAAVAPLIHPDDPQQNYIIPRCVGVSHSSLVLESPRNYVPCYKDEQPPPLANPRFSEMANRASAYLLRGSGK
jgi:esterase/lipase